MVARRTAAAVLAAVAAAAGCSEGDADEPSTSAPPRPATAAAATSIPLGDPPEAVGQLCGIVALQKQQVLCPTRFPRKAGSQATDGKPLAPDSYEGYGIEWQVTGFRGSDRGHVVVGGQPKPLGLGREIRRESKLRLRGRLEVLRRGVAVGRSRGVVVRTASGRVAVLWNQDRRGYMTSLGFAGHPLRDRIAAAIGMARSSSPVPPGGSCDPGSDCG